MRSWKTAALALLAALLVAPFVLPRSAMGDDPKAAPPGPDPNVARQALIRAQARGKEIWTQSWGPDTKACVECHAPNSPNRMRAGRIKSYPKYDFAVQKILSSQQKLNRMIQDMSKGKPLPLGSDDLNALEAYLATMR